MKLDTVQNIHSMHNTEYLNRTELTRVINNDISVTVINIYTIQP